jgi:hypothetical protein
MQAKIGQTYASQIIEELLLNGALIDLHIIKQQQLYKRVSTFHLSIEEEIFLLSLWTESPSQPNGSYTKGLRDYYGAMITSQFIGTWLEKQFDHSGRFET